ncbi:hypothetical protein C8R44DRAFT_750375 [Mycena epipterygia]|nr:hypothetical protein C8R44DRAFT_750375 [Mycena epipterygia]
MSLMHSVSHRAECILRPSLIPHTLDPILGERSEDAWLLRPLFYDVVVMYHGFDFRLRRRAHDGDPVTIEPKETRWKMSKTTMKCPTSSLWKTTAPINAAITILKRNFDQ